VINTANSILIRIVVIAIWALGCNAPQGARLFAADTADIVIYGGTPAGISAAIQAHRMGKSVVLIEPSNHLGGMTAGGLGATDIGNKAAIGGFARDFYHRIWKHYQKDAAWTRETRAIYNAQNPRYLPKDETMWTFEPHVASEVFRGMLAEANIKPHMRERIDRENGENSLNGVKKDGLRIVSIKMESGRTFAGKMFIDATYEGDLMDAAGVQSLIGREANNLRGETLNGFQPKLNTKNHRFVKPVDPYMRPGDRRYGLVWGIDTASVQVPMPKEGSSDEHIQAYCYRLCTTDVPANRRAWPKPADYDESHYELLLRNFEAGDDRAPWHPLWMPNRKTDTNNNGAFSTDYIGGSFDYPSGTYERRDELVKEHRSYQEGLLWTLANHPRVPPKVRAEFQRLGLAKDEFVDNDNWPTQLYVREARRMFGTYIMTEQNCRGAHTAEDSIGLAAYGMDSHNCQRYVTADGHVQNEGDVQIPVPAPYPISYLAITPRAEDCDNLLVPVCLSATHIAYGSIRMEPVFMILGQSAATAAALAIDEGVAVQKLEYRRLRERLLDDGQVLAWAAKRPAAKPQAAKEE
jgi:hypothetical protein